MNHLPQESKPQPVNIDAVHTTEMTLEARSQMPTQANDRHIRVSHEFLGGCFDAKA